MNNILREKQNNRYRKKYKFIKRRIKSLILENAALCDEVAKIQESILIVKDERKFLLRKLLEYVHEADNSQKNYRHEVVPNGSSTKLKKRKSLEENGRSISIS
ncbi:hypothetical protein MSG28_006174 [Choristoneura fumiferana]|uniref:Uncharacterized protein n=1 Tax=Choristoneura fumiferana TaxID=7141 RepID=A0ACC0JE41_CHOFU|nr:hypothetical protein MSG28_006174 [Choristoneura fumiferana]